MDRMSRHRIPGTRLMAGFLRWGSLGAIGLTLVGLVMMTAEEGLPTAAEFADLSAAECLAWCSRVPGGAVALAGLIALVAVSVARLPIAAVAFLRGGEKRAAGVSLVTLLLVVAAALFRLVQD